MHHMYRGLALTSLIVISLAFHSLLQAKELIPLSAYFAMPTIERPQLSPDGKHILALVPNGNNQSVVVTEFGKRKFSPIVQLKDDDDRIESMYWLNNEKIIIYSSYAEQLAGQTARFNSLYTVNRDGSNLQVLQVPKRLRNPGRNYSTVSVLSVLPNDPEHILVQAYTKVDNYPAAFKVNIDDGKFTKVFSSVKDVRSWLANRDGEILVGVKRKYNRVDKENDITIIVRSDTSSDNWESIYTYQPGEKNSFKLQSYLDDTTVLVSTDYGENQQTLRKFDLQTKEFGELVFKVDGYDLDSVLKRNDEVIGVGYTDDFYTIEYFDKQSKALQGELQAIFPGSNVYLSSSSRNYKRLIASVASQSSPTKFYLVDLDKGAVTPWMSTQPSLEGHQLPAKQKLKVTTRDGKELVAYFTMGKDYGDSPLVVLPHGGPHSRDTQAFDSWTQMLARRGYAVLQVNFRGSSGYGNAFEAAGYKQWGKLMQNDVYDAVKFINDNNLANTQKSCIVVSSYGGYVALTAGFQQPDMFDCVVSVNGIADIPDLIAKDSEWGGGSKAYLRDTIGDVDNSDELAALKANSAINFVENFKVPVLLIAGENDTRVHFSQSRDFYEAMKSANKDVQYILLDKGTHFIDTAAHRETTFSAIDKFIVGYLGE